MTPRKILRHPMQILHRRPRTRVLEQPWPFLFSVIDGEVFKNLPGPASKGAKKSRKSGHRVKIEFPDAPF